MSRRWALGVAALGLLFAAADFTENRLLLAVMASKRRETAELAAWATFAKWSFLYPATVLSLYSVGRSRLGKR